MDARFELFFRSPDTPAASPADLAGQKHSAAAPPKLLAYYDVSTNYKAVKHHLREAASTYQIDYELLQALISTESGFDRYAVSPKGAVGLMQLIPATAQRYGVRADAHRTVENKLTDPRTNIQAGAKYLRDLLMLFPGQPELALAAYNAGEGAVQRAGNRIPNYPETQNYVKTVMHIYTALKPPPVIAQLRKAKPSASGLPVPVGNPSSGPVGGAVGRGNMVPTL
ncbi:MAG: lytic transglycosylase domain-containing protein [Burkholderiaceae bacterium]